MTEDTGKRHLYICSPTEKSEKTDNVLICFKYKAEVKYCYPRCWFNMATAWFWRHLLSYIKVMFPDEVQSQMFLKELIHWKGTEFYNEIGNIKTHKI